MDQQIQQFQRINMHCHGTIKPNPYTDVSTQCQKIENRLVQDYIQQTIEKMLGLMKHECDEEHIQNLIFAIKFKFNQTEEFQIFLNKLDENLTARKEHVFGQRNVKFVNLVTSKDIRDIIYYMYMHNQEHQGLQITVFIVSEITYLNKEDLIYLEKAIKNFKYMLVFSTMNEDMIMGLSPHYSLMAYEIYDNKRLFCKFIYQCLLQTSIKAYLPQQILNLISDMDFYPISFRQSCRRFVYCLEASFMQRKHEFTYVDFKEVIEHIETAIKKIFVYYQGYKTKLSKILKVILKEDENYMIHGLEHQVAFRMKLKEQSEEQLIQKSREYLQKCFSSNVQYKKYLQVLQQKQGQYKPLIKKKKSRMDLLQINYKNNITPKIKFEMQITKIIKLATLNIRTQANQIIWSDLKYQLRIKPQIPYLIAKGLNSNLYKGNHLVEQIAKHYKAPISYYLNDYDNQELGQTIYYIKELQFCGIINMSKHMKPFIENNYYEKANFSSALQQTKPK